ncbi:hypothetical protein Cgig2_003233 [Carnegiea gigantea]|uniref:Uncharacterized protein n=1 Tax=Carnegiea gigantea TaxID=171969 RepID=A0A9Q1JTQ9_9CARY|nr:hypothetical protein Cgig2_003233 [Carnegiea gigantea]
MARRRRGRPCQNRSLRSSSQSASPIFDAPESSDSHPSIVPNPTVEESPSEPKTPIKSSYAALVNPEEGNSLNFIRAPKPQAPVMDEDGFIQVEKRSSARQIPNQEINSELSISPNNFLALMSTEAHSVGLRHIIHVTGPSLFPKKIYNPSKQLQGYLVKTQQALLKLNKDKYHDLRSQQVKAREALEQVQQEFSSQPNNADLKQKEKEVRDQYISITSSVMDIIRQQSKAEWINFGDASTKYIFSKAKQRKLESYVYAIQDEKGDL